MTNDGDIEGGTARKNCTLSLATVTYLEKLAKTGTHGSSVSGVMTHLIMQGIQQAIKDDFIQRD